MPKLEKPKNDYALAVLLLIENYTAGVSPAIYCKEYFHKFPWRVKEVKERHPKLKFLNNSTTKRKRNGKMATFKTIVPTSPIPYLRNLYSKLNREGLK